LQRQQVIPRIGQDDDAHALRSLRFCASNARTSSTL
jgi:hypothetical protein